MTEKGGSGRRRWPAVAAAVVAIVAGLGGGYLVGQRAIPLGSFSNYTDAYVGLLDDGADAFLKTMPLIGGFAEGGLAFYWMVHATSPVPNNAYVFVYDDGKTVRGQFPVVDVLPTEASYSDFWRIFEVTVPRGYPVNSIKSLATLDRARSAGLVSVQDTGLIENAPVVARGVKTQVVNGLPELQQGWYRGSTVTLAVFETDLRPNGLGQVSPIPIWLIQRAADHEPLLEIVRTVDQDLNRDGDLYDSNDLIDLFPGDPGYSPLWAVAVLHVRDTYLRDGFPPFPADPAVLRQSYGMFTSIAEARADPEGHVDRSIGQEGVTPMLMPDGKQALVNCPALPSGVLP